MQLLFIRCILTDVAAQIVQIIQSVKIRLPSIDMTDLCDNLTFQGVSTVTCILLGITNTPTYQTHSFCTYDKSCPPGGSSRSTPEHPLSNVQNPLYDLIIIHSNSSFFPSSITIPFSPSIHSQNRMITHAKGLNSNLLFQIVSRFFRCVKCIY